MNDKIKQFAAQAGFENGHQDRYGNSLSQELEKFAELIVKECAQIVEESSLPDAYSEPCLVLIAEDIKEHFGVEE